ncbi:MAG: PIG-L family deacetylase, partial [Acidobacteriaceae bacterium]|nr:PIG-L family deacetylase [Acidobacteriaceae bacterium]
DQIKEGLRPWTPVKVYGRVPNFEATKEGIYDYATDKYVPVRFFDYVNREWISGKPAVSVRIPEGNVNTPSGYTFLQIGREGLGKQKSQNAGVTMPPAAPYMSSYHRYGSHVGVPEQERSIYDGIDVSLTGIASLAKSDDGSLKPALQRISTIAEEASARFNPGQPGAIAPLLADGLSATRSLVEAVEKSDIPEPGKSDVAFELRVKERQFEHALKVALALSFHATVAPEKEPGSRMPGFRGPSTTFTVAVPGQSFGVDTNILNQGSEAVNIEEIRVTASDGKDWMIHGEASKPESLTAGKDCRSSFGVKVPKDATLTRPYFSRPDEEQPYYDLKDEGYQNVSFAPYPLVATARINYRGAEFAIRKYVQTMQRVEGIGTEANPLLAGPAISVAISPAAGAVPLKSKSFVFSCSLHSNVSGTAEGVLRLRLPEDWRSSPAEHRFSFRRQGDGETVSFEVFPNSIKQETYLIKAAAEYGGATYEEGYRLVGYPGVRPYPYYRPATYKAVGVDVTTAPGLRVAFIPGTGDEVARALQDLGVPVRVIAASDIETTDLSKYDAVVLGVRAYAIRPELRSSNDRLLEYVKNGGALIVQYNLQSFDRNYGPYPFSLGSNPAKVVDETSTVKLLDPANPVLNWPNKITAADFSAWEEERGHGFMDKWDSHYTALLETHDPDQPPQSGGLLLARYGKGFYIYDAYALYRQLPAGVPGAYRILANLVSAAKNPNWK